VASMPAKASPRKTATRKAAPAKAKPKAPPRGRGQTGPRR
jgi:hypothetical protein